MNPKHDHKSSWLDDPVGARHDVPSGDDARDESKGTACRAPTRDLPEGWVWKTLGETCHVILGQSPESATYSEKEVQLLDIGGHDEVYRLGDRYIRSWDELNRIIEELNGVLAV
jgi:hypothetical protein